MCTRRAPPARSRQPAPASKEAARGSLRCLRLSGLRRVLRAPYLRAGVLIALPTSIYQCLAFRPLLFCPRFWSPSPIFAFLELQRGSSIPPGVYP